ncbi:SusC/RagA family TonB-linked outer membrane protein [Sphingobacterium cellulitidis]|uniref:SusC/RagA family TonB-linked outer membrane protein n=1 Tax=Sphingobacterium cellulitidis TaxID=1768011 RepID=UPI0015C60E21|nr:SusC/RagA family TonB-linked outer membrane protein [Sphingobacterium cellulitidis]
MKLTFFLFLFSMFGAMANSNAQKINLDLKGATLKKAFLEITKQTGFIFIYEEGSINPNWKVNLKVSNQELQEVMPQLLEDRPLQYKRSGKSISISMKPISKNVTSPIKESSESNAQETIGGQVLNEKGEKLAGATIKNLRTGKSYSTDAQGSFSMDEVRTNDMLEISYLGYEKGQVKVDEKQFYNIQLNPKPESIGEVTVVNTGFQTISKERSTGSYGTVSKAQLEKPATDISQRLVGTIAGVQARSIDDKGNPKFEIRGQSSLLANASPLVVVDGFPIQGDFASINPNDVESVTVLKDAAAGSVWGARSANGVIVVTTKNASKNSPLKVDLNVFTKISPKMDLDYVRPLASSSETVDYEMKAYENWRALPDPISFFDVGYDWSTASILMNEANYGFISKAERDAQLANLKTLDNKKQISDYLLANPAATQYNLSISGGSERMTNYLSFMHQSNQSNFKETDSKKYLINFRNNSSITKWLDVTLGANYLYNKDNNSGVTLADLNSWSPYDMLKNPDGSFTNIHRYYTPILDRDVPTASFPYSDWTYNPILEIANRKLSVDQSQARFQGALNFKLLNGLTAELRGQYEYGNYNTQDLYNENSFEVRKTVNESTTWDSSVDPNVFIANLPLGGILKQKRVRTDLYNVRGQLRYNREFGVDHELDALAGMEFQSLVGQTFENPPAYGYNEETLAVGTFPNGPGGPKSPIYDYMGQEITFPYLNTFGYTTQRLFSAYGNAAYTYKQKYVLSGSYRFDASNLITDNPRYRYAPFFSIGGMWHAHKEGFMENIDWVDRLSARITYGKLGNYDPSTTFRPLITPSQSPDLYINGLIAGFASYGNPTLRWEQTSNWDLGVDFSLFDHKLFGKVDFYKKNGTDLLAELSIPSIHGTFMQKLNNAAMVNKGVEVELGTSQNLSSDIQWTGNLNFSYNKNEITDLFVVNYNAFQMPLGGTAAYVKGYDANTAWRWVYSGIENNQPTKIGPEGQPFPLSAFPEGDPLTYLKNMGTMVAPYTLGFMNSFKYKDFNFSFIVTGKFGHVFQTLGFNYPPNWVSRVLPNAKLTDVNTGDPSKIVPLPLNKDDSEYYIWEYFTGSMDYLIQSASHVRLQEVNLSYTFPSSISNKIGLNNVLLYAQGNNLFSVYSNKAGEDPEYPMGSLRLMPSYTFGLKFDF